MKRSSKHREKRRGHRLTLMRVTVVEAQNLVIPDGQACRPYVSIRVGSQLGQTKLAGGFKWNGQKIGKACGWYQSFDLVVRQHPNPADLEDILSLRLLSYQVLKAPQVLGRADISVETLGDPFWPPDSGSVIIDNQITNLPSQTPYSPPPDNNIINDNTTDQTRLSTINQYQPPEQSSNSKSPSSSSSSTSLYTSTAAAESPSRRGSQTMKRRSLFGGDSRQSLMHRCAQDFWVPLSGSTHAVDNIHVGELRLRVLLLPIPSSHRLHEAYPWLTRPSSSNTSTTKKKEYSSSQKKETQVVDAREETAEDRSLVNTKLREQLSLARFALDSSHTTSQHRTNWAWGKGGGGNEGVGDDDEDSDDEDDEDDEETRSSSSLSASNLAKYDADVDISRDNQRSRTESVASLKESVALMSEKKHRKRRKQKMNRWRKGNFTLRVEERYGWDFASQEKSAMSNAGLEVSQEGRQQTSQEVVDEMIREQHAFLLESNVGKWLKPVAWAIRNPPAFGDIPDYSTGESHSPHNQAGGLNSYASMADMRHRLDLSAPPVHAIELRRLVLNGPPEMLRCMHGRGAFRFTSGSWLNILPSAYCTALSSQHQQGHSRDTPPLVQRTDSESDEMLPPPPPLFPSASSSPLLGGGRYFPSSSPNFFGGHSSTPSVPLPVLGRLQASVPRVHVVADGTAHVAIYRVRVTMKAPAHLPQSMRRLSALNISPKILHTNHEKDEQGGRDSSDGASASWADAPFQSSFNQSSESNIEEGSVVTWEFLRRFSEFEALLHFLEDSPKAGTAGAKIKQLVTLAPKSLRSVLKWSMTPEFLEERRLSLETALIVLLDACRIPSAVCGFKGLQLSALGQASLLRFLEVPETFFAAPPPSSQVTRIASNALKRILYFPKQNNTSSSLPSSAPPTLQRAATDPSSTSTSRKKPPMNSTGTCSSSIDPTMKFDDQDNYSYLDFILDDEEEEAIDNQDVDPTLSVSSLSSDHVIGQDSMNRKDIDDMFLLEQNKRIHNMNALHFRSFIWIIISGAMKKLVSGSLLKPFHSYDEILSKLMTIKQTSHSNSPTTGPYRYLASSFSQIDLDIWRTKMKPVVTSKSTLPSAQSRTRSSTSRKKPDQEDLEEVSGRVDEAAALTRVLRAFVLCKPTIGYCQAMNYVALYLLRSSSYCSDERSTLALLLILGEDIVPGYWSSEMQAMQADMALLNRLVSQVLPQLSYHLEDIHLPLDLFAAQWLVSLFSAALPPASVAKVWDWLFLDGPTVLLSVSLALLRRAEEKLLLTDDLQKCAEILNNEAMIASDSNELLDEARKELANCEAKGLHVKHLRELHSAEVTRKKEQIDQKKRNKRIALASLVRVVEGTPSEQGRGSVDEAEKRIKKLRKKSLNKKKKKLFSQPFGQKALNLLNPTKSFSTVMKSHHEKTKEEIEWNEQYNIQNHYQRGRRGEDEGGRSSDLSVSGDWSRDVIDKTFEDPVVGWIDSSLSSPNKPSRIKHASSVGSNDVPNNMQDRQYRQSLTTSSNNNRNSRSSENVSSENSPFENMNSKSRSSSSPIPNVIMREGEGFGNSLDASQRDDYFSGDFTAMSPLSDALDYHDSVDYHDKVDMTEQSSSEFISPPNNQVSTRQEAITSADTSKRTSVDNDDESNLEDGDPFLKTPPRDSYVRKKAVTSADTTSPFKRNSLMRRRSLSEDSILTDLSPNPAHYLTSSIDETVNRRETLNVDDDYGEDDEEEEEEEDDDDYDDLLNGDVDFDANDDDSDDDDEAIWGGDGWTVVKKPTSPSEKDQPKPEDSIVAISPGQRSLIEVSAQKKNKLTLEKNVSRVYGTVDDNVKNNDDDGGVEHIIVHQPTRAISNSDSIQSDSSTNSGESRLASCFQQSPIRIQVETDVVNENNDQPTHHPNQQPSQDQIDTRSKKSSVNEIQSNLKTIVKTYEETIFEKRQRIGSTVFLIDLLHSEFLCLVHTSYQIEENERSLKISNQVGSLINSNDVLKKNNSQKNNSTTKINNIDPLTSFIGKPQPYKRPTSILTLPINNSTIQNDCATAPEPLISRMISDSFKLSLPVFAKLMKPALKVALMNNLTILPGQIKTKFKKSIESVFIAFKCNDSGNDEGVIDWQEVLHCWALLAGGTNMTLIEKLNLCFCICDRSCIGMIDRSEVSALLLYSLDLFSPKVSKMSQAEATRKEQVQGDDFQPRPHVNYGDDDLNDNTGVSYSSDSIPLILDDLFPPSELTSMPKLSLDQFIRAVLSHPTVLDFILLGPSVHLFSQLEKTKSDILFSSNQSPNVLANEKTIKVTTDHDDGHEGMDSIIIQPMAQTDESKQDDVEKAPLTPNACVPSF